MEDKGQELIRRLLSYVDETMEFAIRALSAARAFNLDIYVALGDALRFNPTTPAFNVLKRFSFIWEARTRGQDWYRIHALLRRLFAERPEDGDRLRNAHAALEQYYRDRAEAGDGAAITEAIYHANRLDRERGVTEWVEVFDQALELSRYGQCGVLLEVRNELHIDSSFQYGMVSQSEGAYFAVLARYNEARQEYEEAIAAYAAALTHAPGYVAAHNNKGNVLQSLGDLQAQLGEIEQAVRSLRVADAEWSRSLEIAPGDQRIRELRDQVQALLEKLEQQAGNEDEEDRSDMADVLEYFELLLQAIAAVAAGDTAQQGEIEQVLADLETKGWHFSEAVQRIWTGERDETALTAGLYAQDTALVKRLLQIVGEGSS